MNERISLIGGAGFIGTRLARRLAAAGQDFEILDLKPSRSFPERSRIVDIRDIDALRAGITGRIIVNLAAVHRDDVTDPSLYTSTNVGGTRNICEAAREMGIRRIIFTSSVAVYGFAPVGTGEDGRINPINAYGQSKWEAEEVLERWYSEDMAGRELVIVRPTVVFGEGNRGNVYNLLKQIASGRFLMVGSGDNRKSMAYVENVAAFLECACHADVSRLVVNYVDEPDFDMNRLVVEARQALGKGAAVGFRVPYPVGLALGQVADLLSSLVGRPLPISAIRVRKFCANTSFTSAKHRLGDFTPPVSLAEGLRRTLVAEFLEPDPEREIFFTE